MEKRAFVNPILLTVSGYGLSPMISSMGSGRTSPSLEHPVIV